MHFASVIEMVQFVVVHLSYWFISLFLYSNCLTNSIRNQWMNSLLKRKRKNRTKSYKKTKHTKNISYMVKRLKSNNKKNIEWHLRGNGNFNVSVLSNYPCWTFLYWLLSQISIVGMYCFTFILMLIDIVVLPYIFVFIRRW